MFNICKQKGTDMGWAGTNDEILNALRTVGADKDEDGNFLIVGAPPISFMGLGKDIVISDKVMYLKDGKPCSLVVLMNGTGRGVNVTVIGGDI